MHPRNRHQGRYNFPELIAASGELASFVRRSAAADFTLDFANPAAVKALNRALLLKFYGVQGWDIPPGYLCPPIPGRADYVHHLADLLAESNGGRHPPGERVRVLDIGVGANGVYALLGHAEYGWSFIGSDTDATAIASLNRVLAANAGLAASIVLRQQPSPLQCFAGVLEPDETIDLAMCNPPFHASAEDAAVGSSRKWRNLGQPAQCTQRTQPTKRSRADDVLRNFSGQAGELWCAGGERAFVLRMIEQSRACRDRCLWFSALVSKESNLPPLHAALRQASVVDMRSVDMAQGQKRSRFVAWTFLDCRAMDVWIERRFGVTNRTVDPPSL